ncbi:MAG: TPM domain-containing protein [Runella slithyformis]|nr:MAG: TPM domain-containing protein [Runella slithyformis]TAE95838.1 MAG: TPM domain-containing protein [Runella slithyformis]TAF28564.1 MAG: TPM domain-containing protein [Runella slithyformis]TAF47591.1 MAG: TPM domain-containing protein [Runella slithyformis]TAF78936.1 MAG: TPM domain-containing protein [Runella slithyformis]
MEHLLFTETEQKLIIEAIKTAELNTSGEVRVHVEHHCPYQDALTRAQEVFAQLNMHRTDLQNGVLFYVAVTDRKFAVLGDKGIDQKVPANFWNDVRDILKQHFVNEKFSEGLSKGIMLAGEQLKAFFPRQNNDKNELSDDISFG